MTHRDFLYRVSVVFLICVCVPATAAAGFRETRNAAGFYVYRLSGAQTKFYEGSVSTQAGYEAAPTWGYGLRVRTYSSREVGLDLSVLYASRKGDEARVSSILVQAGPMLPIPLAGESKVVIPYGSVGLTLLRTAFDVESQLDFGFHVKIGVEVAALKVLGVCLEGQYTIVTVRNREDHGIYDYLDKSYSFGDAAWSVGIHYYP